MNLKYIFPLFFLLGIYIGGYSQSKFAVQTLSDTSIKFSVYYASPKLLNDGMASSSHYDLFVKFTLAEKDSLRKISSGEWLNLLENENTQWGANLFLYEIYKKDALLYYTSRSKRDWHPKLKKRKILIIGRTFLKRWVVLQNGSVPIVT